MDIIATCQPALGHFHAVAGLALAMAERGHDVTVATAPGMGPVVERSGLRYVSVGPEWLAQGPRPGALDDPRRRLRLMSVATGALISDLLDLCRDRQPDVVIHESLEWAAPLAAEAAGVPYAAVGQLPRLPGPVVAERMGPGWELARARMGLDPDPAMERLYPYLYLDAYLPSFQPLTHSPLDWLATGQPTSVSHLVEPPHYHLPGPVPDWLDQLPDRPTLYVTMGTAFNQVPELFGMVAEALAPEHLNVVMTLGPGMDQHRARSTPSNMWVTDYIPQREIMARSDAVLCHSGYLTVVGALQAALPMVLVPVAVDQPYHAHRLTAAGAGVMLDHRRLRSEDIAAAVKTVLHDPLPRANAERLRQELAAMPSLSRGVELVEELARTRAPIVAGVDA